MDSVSIVLPAHQAKRQGVKSLAAGECDFSLVTMTIHTAHAQKRFRPANVVPKKYAPGGRWRCVGMASDHARTAYKILNETSKC